MYITPEQVLAPVEIVIPSGHADRPLYKKILAVWGSEVNPLQTQVGAIHRRCVRTPVATKGCGRVALVGRVGRG